MRGHFPFAYPSSSSIAILHTLVQRKTHDDQAKNQNYKADPCQHVWSPLLTLQTDTLCVFHWPETHLARCTYRRRILVLVPGIQNHSQGVLAAVIREFSRDKWKLEQKLQVKLGVVKYSTHLLINATFVLAEDWLVACSFVAKSHPCATRGLFSPLPPLFLSPMAHACNLLAWSNIFLA